MNLSFFVNWNALVFLVKAVHFFSSSYCSAHTSSPVVIWLGVSSEGSGISFYIHGVAQTLHLQWFCGWMYLVKILAFPFTFMVLHTHFVSSCYVVGYIQWWLWHFLSCS
jgi:hypothetical protein